ncbi:MAG: hypothetical protein RLZZ65_526 [Bacteroidota bacterium]|jgi:hypothetical protein
MWRLLLFCWVTTAHAQLVLNNYGQAFGQLPFFNAATVAQLHLKSIEGFYTYKKADAPFKESLDWVRYRFDEKGQLTEQLEVIQNGKRKDSTLHQYAYFPSGLLMAHRYGAYGGAISEHYRYDSLNRVVEINYFRDQFSNLITNSAELVFMRKEYKTYPSQQSPDFIQFNQYNLPFMEVSQKFNEAGYLLETERYYKMSQQKEIESFTYNNQGLLSEKKILHSNTTTPPECWQYDYDQFGNLIEINYQKNGFDVQEYQVIYDYKTGYLGALIKKDLRTNELKIIRFSKNTYY